MNLVSLNNENKDNIIKFLESLDDDDDVQNIFTNAKFENWMLIISIDPGINGAICFFENGEVKDVLEMPTMAEGKKK